MRLLPLDDQVAYLNSIGVSLPRTITPRASVLPPRRRNVLLAAVATLILLHAVVIVFVACW